MPSRHAPAFVLCCTLIASPAAAQVAGLPSALSDADTRLTTGVESLSLASTKGTQHFLMDFMLTAPLAGEEVKRRNKPVAEAWFNVRFNGAPNNAVSGIKQFVGGFEDELVAGDTSSLLNALSLRAGLEFRMGRFQGRTFQKHYQFQPVFIAAIGVTTVPALNKPAVFTLTDEARAHWGVPAHYPDKETTPIKYIGFTEPDRRRYYKKFEVGVRLKTHHFDHCAEGTADCDPDARINFPGTIDLTLGQDAAITGGRRRGVVGRIDAFYPLPTDTLANAIYLFGRVRVQWVDEVPAEESPIILRAADAAVTVPSDELWLHTLTPDERTRDDWKFGIGVDLVRLFTGAAGARAKEEAAALAESFPSVPLYNDEEVAVLNVQAQNNQEMAFTHGADYFVPKTSGRFEVRPPSGEGLSTHTFTKDAVEPALSRRLRYKNVSGGTFEAVLLRVKPGEAKAEELKSFTLENAEAKSQGPPDPRYSVTRVSCKAKCVVTSPKDTDNLLVVLPLSDGAKASVDGKAGEWKAYKPLVAARKAELRIEGGDAAAEFIVLRVR